VQVFDSNTVYRDELLGAFDMDISYVRNQPGHEVYRRWVALIDTSGKRKGVMGYLRVSAVVLGAGETAPAHTEAEEDESDSTGTSLQQMILAPPDVKFETHMLKVNVFQARDLPDMNFFTKSADAFVQVSFGGVVLETKPIRHSATPDWNTALCLPITLPTMSDLITLRVYDFERVGENHLIAQLQVSLATHVPLAPQWLTLYGAPTHGNSAAERAMNDGSTPASHYRGQLLVGIEKSPASADARASLLSIAPATADATLQYELRVDAMEANELLCNGDELMLQVSNGNDKFATRLATFVVGRLLSVCTRTASASAPTAVWAGGSKCRRSCSHATRRSSTCPIFS
jgi:hypothetical protein